MEMAAHGYNVLWHWHPSKDTASPVTLHARRLLDENQLAERVMVSLDVAVYAEGGRVGEQVLPLTFAREVVEMLEWPCCAQGTPRSN